MGGPAPSGPWIYLVPLIAVAMIVLRNARTRRLKVERLWISPALFLLLPQPCSPANPFPAPR
jgi:hypothetical protein